VIFSYNSFLHLHARFFFAPPPPPPLVRSEFLTAVLMGGSHILGCDAVSLGEWFPTFRRNAVPSSDTGKQSLKAESTTFLGNDVNHSPNDTASHPRRRESFSFLFRAKASPNFPRSLISRLRCGFVEWRGGLCFMCAPSYVLPQNNLTQR
jgi:hypothetical protein